MFIEVYTDGSATTPDKPGGYGYVLIVDGKKHSEGSGYMPLASNNDAELEAAIQGLSAASKLLNENSSRVMMTVQPGQPPFKVTLVSDSQIVLGWTSGQYAFKQHNKIDKYNQLNYLARNLRVDTRWVEGHTGDENNERCDRLANAARLQQGIDSIIEKPKKKRKETPSIGLSQTGVMVFWYKNVLKIIDLENNLVEDYNETIHGPRSSHLELDSRQGNK